MTDCKEMCWTQSGGMHYTVQCSRKATRDGYCGHHHPEKEKQRAHRARIKFSKMIIEWGLIRNSKNQERAHKENNIREWCKENGYKLTKI